MCDVKREPDATLEHEKVLLETLLDAALKREQVLLETLRKLLDAMTDLEWSTDMTGSDDAKDAARRLLDPRYAAAADREFPYERLFTSSDAG